MEIFFFFFFPHKFSATFFQAESRVIAETDVIFQNPEFSDIHQVKRTFSTRSCWYLVWWTWSCLTTHSLLFCSKAENVQTKYNRHTLKCQYKCKNISDESSCACQITATACSKHVLRSQKEFFSVLVFKTTSLHGTPKKCSEAELCNRLWIPVKSKWILSVLLNF